MGKRSARREQGALQVIPLHEGNSAPSEKGLKVIGSLGRGLMRLAEWGVAVLPGVVMMGQPGEKQLQRVMKAAGVGEGEGRWWLRLDRGGDTGHSLRRGLMGGSEAVLDRPTAHDVLEAMQRLAGQTQQRLTMGARGLIQHGANEPAVNEPGDHEPGLTFILQRLDGAAANKVGDGAGAGVGFTRDPATGSDGWVIRFLAGGQGRAAVSSPEAVGYEKLPGQVQKQLQHIKAVLEKRTGAGAEIEFGIIGGKVFVHRLERARLSAGAAVRAAVELAQSGVINPQQAIDQVDPSVLSQLLLPQFEAESRSRAKVLAQGFAASPGVAVGRLVFSAGEALRRGGAGEAVILVQPETYAQDVAGMRVCQGVLTSSGGMTSHAAVVARGWGLCAVVGAGGVHVDVKRRCMKVGERVLTDADTLSLDGATGEVLEGAVTMKPAKVEGHVQPLLTWADELRRMQVLANADSPEDAKKARELGAQGIGLCRTEHMFFAPERLLLVRRMLLGDATDHDRHSAVLSELRAMQQGDFEKLLEVMDGLPVTIRLLDAPLHEFLPGEEDKAELRALGKALGISTRKLRERMTGLREVNPMLGLRGCRLSLLRPEVLRMQVGAVLGAVRACCERGVKVEVGLMFPLVSTEEELVQLVRLVGEERSGQEGGGPSELNFEFRNSNFELNKPRSSRSRRGLGYSDESNVIGKKGSSGQVGEERSGQVAEWSSGQVKEKGSGRVVESTARPHPSPLPGGEGTESGRVVEEESGQVAQWPSGPVAEKGTVQVGLGLGKKRTDGMIHPSPQPPAPSSKSGRLRIGVMIETPRAAVLAGRLAKHVDFLSLGTNDLTQMTFGFSRDDIGSFLPTYLEKGLLTIDPFVRLDQSGVGELIRRAVEDARAANPAIHINLCGEHGGDPASIAFARRIGLDSVSCSPLRLPVARLAGAKTE